MKKYKVATITCDPKLGQKEHNLKEQLGLAEQAAKEGAKIIALPEMANIGYCWYSREDVAPHVEPIPGETTGAFERIAKQYDCYIVVGIGEVDQKTDIYYNSAALIGPDGVVGIHRKSHAYVCEGRWAKDGDVAHQVFETPLGRIGLLVCMDINIMETARIEGVRGADVVVCISNWVEDKCPAMNWITRAYENGYYVLVSDRCGLERGTEFNGGSCLIGPDGEVISIADDGPSIAYGEVDLNRAGAKTFFGSGNKMTERRPELYMDITLDPYLWDPILGHGLYNHDPLPEGKVSKVAAVQMHSEPGDPEKNFERIREEVIRLADDDAELIVFPELALSGIPTQAQAQQIAEPVPGSCSDRLIDLCKRHRVSLVVGQVEADQDARYNTAVLYSPEGILGKYRKCHLDANDREWATPGENGAVWFNTPLGRVSILIGHDANFPELARIHALHGVDIICCPSAVEGPIPGGLPESRTWHKSFEPYGYDNTWWHLWRVRGGDNNCYTIFANAVGDLPGGRRAMGRSGIFQPMIWKYPRNEVLLDGTSEDAGTLVISTESLVSNGTPTGDTRKKYLMPMRKPIWYDPIVERNYPASQ